MKDMPFWLKIILWIYFFPVMLIIYIASKFGAVCAKPGTESMQEAIMAGRCPNCGKPLKKTPQTGHYYYSCPNYCVSFTVDEGTPYYKSNYFDEREAEKRFKITSPYITRYNVNGPDPVSDYTGVVPAHRVMHIEKAFEALQTRTVLDTPITEEDFRTEIENGRKLINNICPFCGKAITKQTRFVQGYGNNVTKLTKTGYGEYTLRTEYEGTYDHNVTTYTCGCSDIQYQLSESELDGMYFKKYSTRAKNDAVQRACAFSEVYTSKRTWLPHP